MCCCVRSDYRLALFEERLGFATAPERYHIDTVSACRFHRHLACRTLHSLLHSIIPPTTALLGVVCYIKTRVLRTKTSRNTPANHAPYRQPWITSDMAYVHPSKQQGENQTLIELKTGSQPIRQITVGTWEKHWHKMLTSATALRAISCIILLTFRFYICKPEQYFGACF